MKRLLLTASMLSVLTFGCGHSLMQPATPDNEQAGPATKEKNEQAAGEEVAEAETSESASSQASRRQPGDFATYRFSGSYRPTPVTVSYRVVERDDESILLDVTLQSEGESRRFRLRMSDGSAAPGEILSVARFDGSSEQPFDVAEYEALMQQTVAPIEHNEASLDRRADQMRIGARTLPCTRASYRVLAAGEPATMTVFESPGFAWGDLGGEITTAEGELLYKAEIVEVNESGADGTQAVAATMDEFDLYELDL